MVPNFAKRLKELRLRYGLGQAQVAKMADVTKNAISTYENGTRQPSFETLIRLAVIYRVSTDYLLGVTTNQSLDISGLTEDDAAAVKQLVEILSQKNDLIQKRSTR
ncbi:MAG: helix-turn-helix transcriptional regulator [Clostridia bacterium]|nr:helix-turn-helix transcriptional regulator [Clostridia bacterium]